MHRDLDDLRVELALEALHVAGRLPTSMTFSDLLGVYARLESDYWEHSADAHAALGRMLDADLYPSHTEGLDHG